MEERVYDYQLLVDLILPHLTICRCHDTFHIITSVALNPDDISAEIAGID